MSILYNFWREAYMSSDINPVTPVEPAIEMDWARLYKPTVDRIKEFAQAHPDIDVDKAVNEIIYHGLEKADAELGRAR